MNADDAGRIADLRAAMRSAIEHLSWRIVAVTLALTVALDLYGAVQQSTGSKELYPSAASINVLIGLGIMFATLVADELVAKGARRLPAYVLAVVSGSAMGALAQWPIIQWLQLPLRQNVPGVTHEIPVTQHSTVFFEYLTFASIAVFIYVNRRSALHAAARLNSAQVQRAETQRRSLESRLQALQARIEPQFLFSSLAQVRDLYESDTAKGAQVLGDLIAYLRAALPHLREPASTLRRELELAVAYLKIMRARFDERLNFA